jgi:hypothetical protein
MTDEVRPSLSTSTGDSSRSVTPLPELPQLRTASDAALRRIAMGGLFFLFLAAMAFTSSLFLICIRSIGTSPIVEIHTSDGFSSRDFLALTFINSYLAPTMTFIIGLITASIGYVLLRVAGTAGRDVIPKQDYSLLSRLILDGNAEGINSYIRLSSLSGTIGTFTKLGVSGLPLATIGLTILFAVLGLVVPGQAVLFDLAKLTLGAFIGSYVQRQETESIRSLALSRPASVEQSTKRE